MSWLPIIVLALAAFAFAVLVLKVRRSGWTLLGATLLFGLSGYALQGLPGQPAAPKPPMAADAESGELFVAGRREFYGKDQPPSRWITTGDAFMRRGDYQRAAGFYRNAVEESPADAEGWSALGIALIEQSEGNLTPAAIEALRRAKSLAPKNAAPRYFLGLAWLRAGEPLRTLELWDEALAEAPEGAEWRNSLALRRNRLAAMLAQIVAEQPDTNQTDQNRADR